MKYLFGTVVASIIFTSCAQQQASSPLLPYKDLEGPIPPQTIANAPKQAKNTLSEQLLHSTQLDDFDTKATCIKLLEESLNSSNRQVVLSTLGSYSLIQLHVPEVAAEKLISLEYDPYIQLQLLSTLYATQSPSCKKISEKALLSTIPFIQLYATRFLAESREKEALSRIESLEAKLPAEFLPYCTELYAFEGSPQAQAHIRRIFLSGDSASITLCLRLIRDFQLMELYKDLLQFRPANPQEQEAYAYALGCQNILEHRTLLQYLSKSTDPTVALQASIGLTQFGETIPTTLDGASPYILASAHKTSISTQELESCWTKPLPEPARLNLALSLVERHSPISLPYLFQKLQEGENLIFEPNYSRAGTCFYITEQTLRKTDVLEELNLQYISQAIQEDLVYKIATFFPEEFEKAAPKTLLENSQHLAPAVLMALTTVKTEESSALLKELSYSPGHPLTRQLALFARIQQSEIPLDPAILKPILATLRESLRSLSRPSWFSFFQQRSLSDRNFKKLTEQQRLYFTAISSLAHVKTKESIAILAEEIQATPEPLVPLVTAALLYSLL